MNEATSETPPVDPGLSDARKAARKLWLRRLAVVLALVFGYCMWLVAAAQLAKRVFARYPGAGAWLKRLAGVALIGFGVKLALQK